MYCMLLKIDNIHINLYYFKYDNNKEKYIPEKITYCYNIIGKHVDIII